MGEALDTSHRETQAFASGAGALVGGAVLGTVTGTLTTATSAVRESGGGLVEAATNEDLNFGGKVLDGIGGLPGDIVSPMIRGAGTLLATPIAGAGAAYKTGKASDGAKKAADFGVKSIQAAINPQTMVETVQG